MTTTKKRGRAATPKPDREQVAVVVRMPSELHAQLSRLSNQYQVSLNQIAVNLLSDYARAQREVGR